MPLSKPDSARQSEHARDVQRRLDETDDVLVRSEARLRQAGIALVRARQTNAAQRKQLDECRRTLGGYAIAGG